MGEEYRITTSAESGVYTALCARLGGQQCATLPPQFEFRSPGSQPAPAMPDATVTLDSGEVWFCDNGGSREYVSVLFRHFLDAALSHSQWPDGIRVAQP